MEYSDMDTTAGYGVDIDIERAFRTGFRRTFLPTGVAFVFAFFVVGILGEIASQSGDAYTLGPLGAFVGTGPLDFDLGLPVVLLLSLSAQVGVVVVAVYAFRVFAQEADGFEPRYGHGFGKASVAAVLASAAFALLVTVGLLLFVVPGIYLIVALPFYVIFAALEDDGPVEALRSSWLLTKGSRSSVFFLFAVYLIFAFGTVFLGTVVSEALSSAVEGHAEYAAEVAAVVVEEIFVAFLSVFLLAVLFDVYLQLSDGSQTP